MGHARQESPRSLPAALLAVLLLLLFAAPAQANIGETIIRRCINNESIAGYSQSDYTQALNEIDAGTAEYGECASEILKAQLAAATGHGAAKQFGSSAVVAPVTVTPTEQRAVAHAAKQGSEPVRVGEQTIRPGVVHSNVASAISTLPTPLLAVLVFAAACLLVLAGNAARNRIRARDDG